MEQLGFEQAVLARELNPAEIARIRECTCIRLEVFVHGAVCVSYSGRCYLSEAIKGRSANRGACAQMCRQTYDLVDAEGTYIYKEKYLLSAKDMNRSESLEDLVLAGVTSFKIEGRLKGVSYVKNVTACYSRLLDEIIKKYPDRYERSSKGICKYLFEPDLNRCFNRGYTNNYFHTATPDRPNDNIVNINTPKSTGEFAGVVKKCIRGLMVMNSVRQLHNADGLIFILPDGSYEALP
nr:U32 family peptidase [Porphyromonas macacae]